MTRYATEVLRYILAIWHLVLRRYRDCNEACHGEVRLHLVVTLGIGLHAVSSIRNHGTHNSLTLGISHTTKEIVLTLCSINRLSHIVIKVVAHDTCVAHIAGNITRLATFCHDISLVYAIDNLDVGRSITARATKETTDANLATRSIRSNLAEIVRLTDA